MKLKDKKITIYKPESRRDSTGNFITSWRPIHAPSLWAYVRQLSAKEYYAAATTNSKEETLFCVNWRPGITAKLMIEYRGKFYNITRVDTFEGYKADLKLYASEITGSVPGPDKLLPYEESPQ